MKIHADPITINCRKVLAGLKLMGASHELMYIDYFKGEQKSEAYVKINPNSSIPALSDGELVLWESNAILAYAADKTGADAYYPKDAQKRADINRWMFWESASWFNACYTYLVENCIKPLLGGETDQAVLNSNAEQFNKLAAILDARLATSKYVCGATPTIADIVLAAPMHLHAWQKLPLDQYPNIKRWLLQDIESLACWQDTWVGEGFTTTR